MFKIEDKILLKSNVLIGTLNFPKQSFSIFKNIMAKQNQFNINYIEINPIIIELSINNKREKSLRKEGKMGMISREWLNKYQNEIPCVIIHIIDITSKIMESKEPSLISEEILHELGKIKSAFINSNYIMIIKNLFKSNFELQIKNTLVNNIKYLKDKNIIIINDSNQFENMQFLDNFCELVKDEINGFFSTIKNNYFTKFEKCKQQKDIEFIIKYLIKLFSLSYITHKDNINYSYLFKANLYLRQKIDKKNYKFICNVNNNDNDLNKKDLMNQIITYLEIKNISDYIIYYLSWKKNII